MIHLALAGTLVCAGCDSSSTSAPPADGAVAADTAVKNRLGARDPRLLADS